MANDANHSGIHHPHDSIYRKLLGSPKMAYDVLQKSLSKSAISRIEPGSLQPIRTAFVTNQLNQFFGDMAYQAKYKNGDDSDDCLICFFLIEHQSRPDRWMALRMINYICCLLLDYVDRQGRRQHRLPLVWPLVVYSGHMAYSSPRDIFGLFSEEDREHVRKMFTGCFDLIDFSAMSDKDLLDSPGPLCSMGLMAKHAGGPGMTEFFQKIMCNIMPIDPSREIRHAMVKYLMYCDKAGHLSTDFLEQLASDDELPNKA